MCGGGVFRRRNFLCVNQNAQGLEVKLLKGRLTTPQPDIDEVYRTRLVYAENVSTTLALFAFQWAASESGQGMHILLREVSIQLKL
jgi:hypothetical protein